MDGTNVPTFFKGISNKSYVKTVKDTPVLFPIIRNAKNIEIITTFLKNYKVTDSIKGIIIRGAIGCGKMALVNYCTSKTGYIENSYDTDFESEDSLKDMLISIKSRDTVKKVIVIRDFDNSLKTSQKATFFKCISTSKKTLPIIVTSSDNSVGTIRTVPSCFMQIDFELPSVGDLVKRFSNNKMSKNVLEQIITDSNFDLRYINNVIEGVNPSKKITINNIEKIKNKDIEYDTFNCIKYCSGDFSWENKLTYCSVYTNLTVFQNYPMMCKDLKTLSKISDYCCLSEEIMQYSFDNQNWNDLDDCSVIIGTIIPLELMRHDKFDELIYPSSNVSFPKEESKPFNTLEKESMMLNLLVKKYIKGNKIVGDVTELEKEIKSMSYPLDAYKLASKNATMLRKIKSCLTVA